VETDTQDSTGKVIATRDVPAIGEGELDKLRQAFTGTLMQTPPMFSALKKEGVRLYDLARKARRSSASRARSASRRCASGWKEAKK
jgi:tRNA pseudouridine55 synthase